MEQIEYSYSFLLLIVYNNITNGELNYLTINFFL